MSLSAVVVDDRAPRERIETRTLLLVVGAATVTDFFFAGFAVYRPDDAMQTADGGLA